MSTTNPDVLLATIRQSIISGQVSASGDGNSCLNQALDDIEQLVGKLERVYIRHVAMAREEGTRLERARILKVIQAHGVDTLTTMLEGDDL